MSHTEIPEELEKYTPAELHHFANKIDYAAGKTPAMTLETLFEKAEENDVGVTVFASGEALIFRDEKVGTPSDRKCYSVAELGIALRMGPTFLDRPLLYKGKSCIIKYEDKDEIEILTPHNGFTQIIYRFGVEKKLTNDMEVYLEEDFEAKEAEDDLAKNGNK